MLSVKSVRKKVSAGKLFLKIVIGITGLILKLKKINLTTEKYLNWTTQIIIHKETCFTLSRKGPYFYRTYQKAQHSMYI